MVTLVKIEFPASPRKKNDGKKMGISLRKHFFEIEEDFIDGTYFRNYFRQVVHRLLRELKSSMDAGESQCQFAEELVFVLDEEKEAYVNKLYDDLGEIKTKSVIKPIFKIIVNFDYLLYQLSLIFYANNFPIPQRMNMWKPFLPEESFEMVVNFYQQDLGWVQKEIKQSYLDGIVPRDDLTAPRKGEFWGRYFKFLADEQKRRYDFINMPNAGIVKHIQETENDDVDDELAREIGTEILDVTIDSKSEQFVVEETPSAPSKNIVFAVLEKLQSGNALSQTEEDILKKIKDAKTGNRLATYRSNFITKTFRPKYESVISVLELQGKVPCEWALQKIGCNAWFNEFVLRSIIGNCKGRGKFANRFRGHTVEKKERRDESLRASAEIEEGATDAPDDLVWHLVMLPKNN